MSANLQGFLNTNPFVSAYFQNGGSLDGLNVGEYMLSSVSGNSLSKSYSSDNSQLISSVFTSFNPISASLSIGPAAPAPLVGSGLFSALAALLGLGATRLGRRKLVLG